MNDGLLYITNNSNIPTAYRALFGAYNEQAFVYLLRQWCKHAPDLRRLTYEIPANYARHVRSCQRIAQYEIEGEPLDVVVVHVSQMASWLNKQHVVHALVVRALRNWTPHGFRAVVAYVAPDGGEWRVQFVEQEIESYRDPVRQTMRTRSHVTPAHQYRYDMQVAKAMLVPFVVWDECIALPRGVTLAELKEAFMPVPTTPAEIFEKAYRESIEAIEAYTGLLNERYRQVSFVERAEIDQQKMQLNQLAAQWDKASQALQRQLAAIHYEPVVGIAKVAESSVSYATAGVQLHLLDDWTHKSLVRMQHRKHIYQVTSWTQLYEIVLQQMLLEFGIAVIEKMNAQACERQQREVFARDSANFRAPKQLQGWYFDTHGNANAIRDKVRKLYDAFGIAPKALIVWVQ
jgi:hypothetical protein